MLEKIKVLLGIKDDLQDEVLDILIDNVSSHLKALIGKDLPEELSFIVQEIVIRRFNRIGTEGMKSEAVEGHTVTFYDLKDEFVPYEDIINSYRVNPEEPKRGKVMFI
ncbi:gp6-like head-tail connector protein [Cytobacillus horneckiae]|uniref:phage head-tail connector protein n=1 Tax=Cytobacillus horneckiae TaxID=549687 RepID=UPI0019D18361|nr:phage head-tail connector protein [Cytobacillus horneckiae]MBN6890077.1 phage head-tail connector protein [Cytobacillus horneckiae]